MRILSMTATFGKLEQKTLRLEPGLNIVQAPNEWGKSTWCAFLLAMLYGLDTRARSGRHNLSDKDRFAPWSGSPMSGSMTVEWEGRIITLERSSRGRVPMGEFRAYETDSGLPVPELRGDTCGQMLLGVERSVFQRTGFIRSSEMAVTEDDALRQRLNALVSTGDESGDGAKLEAGLRELKNRIRYRRGGMLPQAEEERDQLEKSLQLCESLSAQAEELALQLEENENALWELENHLRNLDYQRAREDAAAVNTARLEAEEAQRVLQELEQQVRDCPGREETAERLQALRENKNRLDQASWMLETMQDEPVPPERFEGLTPGRAREQVEADAREFHRAGKKTWLLAIFLGISNILGGGSMVFWIHKPELGAVVALVGFVGIWLGLTLKIAQGRKRRELLDKYGSGETGRWKAAAKRYDAVWDSYQQAKLEYDLERSERQQALEELQARDEALRGGMQLEDWEALAEALNQLEGLQTDAQRTQAHYMTLKTMARTAPTFAGDDALQLDREETRKAVEELQQQRQELMTRRGQLAVQLERLGSWDTLREQLDGVQQRITQLEKHYEALCIAQQTLEAATSELQRRFAPRITARAKNLMARLTDNRYDKLLLSSDLSLQAGASEENVLRDALWRSDGTVDQLYLSLRLAVAEELSPRAPLILDDAFIRFDDLRLDAALGILDEMGSRKQVIVFTCQSRESAIAAKG